MKLQNVKILGWGKFLEWGQIGCVEMLRLHAVY